MKHYVLEAYLARWSRVLIKSGKKRLWFVDAFAGRGHDDEGRPGSPLIARNIAKNVAREYPGAQVRLVEIESDEDNFRELETTLADDCGNGGCATVLQGTLSEHIEDVMSMIGSDSALFFLDPWGVKGLSSDIVERLLLEQGRAVLVLFDDDGAERIHASANAGSKINKAADLSLSLFPDEALPAASKRRIPSAETGARSAEASEDVIRVLFGSRYLAVESSLRGLTGSGRRDKLLSEYVELLRSHKATHVLSFSVRDDGDKHHYYLVHASRHKKAFTEMKDAIRGALNKRDESPGLFPPSLFFQSEADISAATDAIASHFAGHEDVRWQDGKKPGTVLAFAEEETQLLYSDMAALKAELQRRGYVVGGPRALTYSFPD